MKITSVLFLLFIFLFACKTAEQAGDGDVAFTGATIIDGSGSSPIRNGVLLIRNGRVIAVGE